MEAFGVAAKFALAVKLLKKPATHAVVEFGGPLLADRGSLGFCAHGLAAESMGTTLVPATSAARPMACNALPAASLGGPVPVPAMAIAIPACGAARTRAIMPVLTSGASGR